MLRILTLCHGNICRSPLAAALIDAAIGAEAARQGEVPVGCVIVRDGRIVGRGHTQPPGEAHAEVMALRDAGDLARGTEVFVTLEPCSHTGMTGPCAQALIEAGVATVEDVDRACRNNAGYWMTLVGVFRWMDLTGVPAYHTVMKELLPTLNNSTEIPRLIDDIVKAGGKGVANAHGFHSYTKEEAELWEETFREFSYEIRRLALKYPADVVKKKMEEREKKKS